MGETEGIKSGAAVPRIGPCQTLRSVTHVDDGRIGQPHKTPTRLYQPKPEIEVLREIAVCIASDRQDRFPTEEHGGMADRHIYKSLRNPTLWSQGVEPLRPQRHTFGHRPTV
jgi:hypothetical protein